MAAYKRIINFNNVPNFSFSLFRNWLVNDYSTSIPRYSKHIDPALPEKPKKPLPPFIRYCQVVRPQIKEENSTLKVTEIIQEAAKRWNFLDVDAKNEYSLEYQKDLTIYIAKLAEYQNSLSPENIEQLARAKKKAQLLRNKNLNKQKLEHLGKPKQPLSPFFEFLTDKKEVEPVTASYREWVKKQTVEWKSLPEHVRSDYSKKWKVAITKYKENLEIWKAKMIAEGHLDAMIHCDSTKGSKN